MARPKSLQPGCGMPPTLLYNRVGGRTPATCVRQSIEVVPWLSRNGRDKSSRKN